MADRSHRTQDIQKTTLPGTIVFSKVHNVGGTVKIKLTAAAALALALAGMPPLHAETPEQWVELGTRIHGAFGAFIPVGIRIGLDARRS